MVDKHDGVLQEDHESVIGCHKAKCRVNGHSHAVMGGDQCSREGDE